ncbi:MAG: Asp23/Gls24 family envelope stress response protein [Thermovenabulum sp.]|uniref:Asp23/Gls24 family envelope stress response protein n=1 Tax=Thermovenabulum sp. TaxID=3100335 RepID=UPI003C79D487
MKNLIKTPLGTINISREVIAVLAGNAAVECYGLVGMVSQKMSDGIIELLGRENLGKGVEVHIDDNSLTVDLYIAVQYGIKISEVAHNVIEKVHYNLNKYLGIAPDKVNVIVKTVRVK